MLEQRRSQCRKPEPNAQRLAVCSVGNEWMLQRYSPHADVCHTSCSGLAKSIASQRVIVMWRPDNAGNHAIFNKDWHGNFCCKVSDEVELQQKAVSIVPNNCWALAMAVSVSLSMS